MTLANIMKHNLFISIMTGNDNLSGDIQAGDLQTRPGLQPQQWTEEEAGPQLVERTGLEAELELSHQATQWLDPGNLEAALQLTVGHCQGHEQLCLSPLGLAPMARQELAQTACPLGLPCRTLQRLPPNDQAARCQWHLAAVP